MIIVRNINLPIDVDFGDLKVLFCNAVSIKIDDIKSVKLYKKSLDARDKTKILFNCSFVVEAENEQLLIKRLKKFGAAYFKENVYVFNKSRLKVARPVVVGFGPAGMFAALSLARRGLRPIVLERGKDALSRVSDVENFFGGAELDENSNIQFGEGGAGTFSDGKLNTGTKDSLIRVVLKEFADHGAGEHILYDSRPHIGTDVLVKVVMSIRKEIISLGGEVRFGHRLIDFSVKNGRVRLVTVDSPEGRYELPCERVILCIGHSARDTFQMLEGKLKMEPKPFAIGARIEHLQSSVNRSQYGGLADSQYLGAADYRLATHLENGRGVFTFCMCPGGVVVNASSEKGAVVTNGMSNSKRDGVNANSALLVGVEVEDYYCGSVLDGMYFQREIEQRAFKIGKGKPVAQKTGDFLKNIPSSSAGLVCSTLKPGVEFGDIREVLPAFVTDAMAKGIHLLDRKLKGFADPESLLTAPETRSSSPIRILRDEKGFSSVEGIMPCGEGAGYAGGITSAAVDGLKAADRLLESYNEV